MNFFKNPQFLAKIVSFLFFILLLTSLEFTAGFFVKKKTELEKILSILQQNTVLFWQIKPNIHTQFQGVEVKTNAQGLRNENIPVKKPNTTRILCMGGSPTFGWGIEGSQAYPKQLETLLQKHNSSQKNIEVINAGIIGFSSYQGLQFLKTTGVKLKPDLVTISYVVNDVDKHRFFLNSQEEDKNVTTKKTWQVLLENGLDQSQLVLLLKRISNQIRLTQPKLPHNAEFGFQKKRRVSPQDYEKNLTEMLSIAKKLQINVVFIPMPIRRPFDKKDIAIEDKEKASMLIKSTWKLIKQDKIPTAIENLEEAMTLDPYNQDPLYLMGYLLNKEGKHQEAAHFFQKATEIELFQCAEIAIEYNQIMKKVAHANQIPMVDVASYFNQQSQTEKNTLYVTPEKDFVHPSSKGNGIIAAETAKVIMQNFPFLLE